MPIKITESNLKFHSVVCRTYETVERKLKEITLKPKLSASTFVSGLVDRGFCIDIIVESNDLSSARCVHISLAFDENGKEVNVQIWDSGGVGDTFRGKTLTILSAIEKFIQTKFGEKNAKEAA